MINQIVVLDEQDALLGDFFGLCADYTHLLCADYSHDIRCRRLDCGDSAKENIEACISTVNQNHFLFLGFLHGETDCMVANSLEKIVSVGDNCHLFTNAFLYAFSCHCGSALADSLLLNGASVFWGYEKKVWVCHSHPEEFKKAALAGYNHFLNGYSISTSYELMVSDMNALIDELYELDMFAASTLMENRDALVLKGNGVLTIEDFNI